MGGKQSNGLMIAPKPRRLAFVHHLTIDGQNIPRLDLHCGAGQGLAIHRHPSFGDVALNLAPRRDACAG